MVQTRALLHAAGQAMHDFVAKCLNKDPAARMSAAELLRHPFLAHAKDERYLAHHLLGPSPVAPKSARTILSRMPGGDTALVRCCMSPPGDSFFCLAQASPECVLSDETASSDVVGSSQVRHKVLVSLGDAGARIADGAARGRRCAGQDVVEDQGCCQEGVHSVPGGVDGLRARPQVLHRLPHGTCTSQTPVHGCKMVTTTIFTAEHMRSAADEEQARLLSGKSL